MENVLQTYQLTKRYGNTAVVDGVSMRVPRGEIYGFVGRNGAGKTTVMRMICGLALKSGGGSPVTILLTLAVSMFLPGGSAKMLAAGGSGYPLYILLPLALSFVCVRIGLRLRARKELN